MIKSASGVSTGGRARQSRQREFPYALTRYGMQALSEFGELQNSKESQYSRRTEFSGLRMHRVDCYLGTAGK